MAYKIEYTPEFSYRYPQTKRKRDATSWKVIMFILLVAAALWMRLNGIPDFLIPGDPVVTRLAASDFFDCVQNGMPIGKAATVFCQQILNGAGF